MHGERCGPKWISKEMLHKNLVLALSLIPRGFHLLRAVQLFHISETTQCSDGKHLHRIEHRTPPTKNLKVRVFLFVTQFLVC